ncbi:MAG: chorismate-binding protein [Phycisphaerae bacterium]
MQLACDGSIVTRPIKGTRPRIGDDDAMRDELKNSEKDRAELTMIVDLLRNDMGRVCRFGSIDVTHAAQVETHPTVHHLVATIVGCVNENVTAVDVLRAMFPGGSILPAAPRFGRWKLSANWNRHRAKYIAARSDSSAQMVR